MGAGRLLNEGDQIKELSHQHVDAGKHAEV